MAITYISFILGFALLIKGADLLVDGAASLARRLRVREIVVGLTVVAFGTSLPELVVNIFASSRGNAELAIGNILGSNIANILLILGVSAVIYPLSVRKNTIWREIPLSVLAAIALGLLVNDEILNGAAHSILSRGEGLILIAFFIIFLYYTLGMARMTQEKLAEKEVKERSVLHSVGLIIGGLVGVLLGGKWVVEGAVAIAMLAGWSESFIGLTIVAVGTSLPELATSAVAAFRRSPDIAIGNVVGSNIFNIFWVLGLSATIRPLAFSLSSNADLAMVILASLLLLLFMFIGKKHSLGRWQGAGFLVVYAAYLAYLVMRG